MPNRIFSDRLAILMSERGVKQARLAEVIGASQPTVSRYLSGDLEPAASDFFKIAIFFGVPMEFFFQTTESEALTFARESPPRYGKMITKEDLREIRKMIDHAVVEAFQSLEKKL